MLYCYWDNLKHGLDLKSTPIQSHKDNANRGTRAAHNWLVAPSVAWVSRSHPRVAEGFAQFIPDSAYIIISVG